MAHCPVIFVGWVERKPKEIPHRRKTVVASFCAKAQEIRVESNTPSLGAHRDSIHMALLHSASMIIASLY